MGKTVVKRFPDGKLFGAGVSVERWANKHNARVISQSASNGWLIVTFELMDTDKGLFGGEFIPMSSTTTIREATCEDLLEMKKADRRRKDDPGKVTVTYLEDPDEDESEKPKKKRWWKRGDRGASN